ncbi:MAG: TonB-dependent receptor [Bacteroidia bacterium]|nr:TonB-dependent receptor [Bacteroidia bacterium]NND52518.1 TonB-dependent receptor [Flavobacteriaceae bacterium]
MHLKSLVISFFIFSSLSNAQVRLKDTVVEQKLDEVILTATRTYRQLSSLPLPAQIVKQEEIMAMNSMRLTDILNEQPGLVTVSEFVGGAGIQMQGLDAQYTLILIDGVPLIGRSAGTLDISRISVGNIKQIEIVKGASSSLYGNKALGGVINIITNKPKTDFHGKLFYRYGTFNTHDTSLNASFKNDNFSWSLFLNRNSSDGYQFPNAANLNTVDPYSNYTLNSKLGFDLTSKTTIFVSGRYYIQDQIYAPTLEEKGEINISEWNAHLKVEHHFNTKLSGDLELYATRYKADEYLNSIENDSLFSKSDYNELLLRPELKGIYKPSDKSTVIAGVGLTHESLDRTDFSTKPIFNSPYIFAQYDGKPKKNLNLILGVRFDSHNEYASQWSPKAAIRFKLNDHLALKGSVGYGFKAPDFRQLYFDYTNGFVGYTILGYNTVVTRIPELEAQGQISNIVVPISEYEDRLNPENSVAYNFGITFDPISTLQFELNLFKNNIHDLIDTRLIANKTNGQNVYSYYNVKDVYTEGLEFNSSWKPSNTLKFSLGYQLLFAKDKAAEDAFAKGEVFARLSPNSPAFQLDEDDYFGLYNRSRHMINLKVFYNYEPWKLKSNIRVNYRSKYGLFDTNSNDYLDRYDEFIEGYMIWNWAVNKRINKHYDMGIGIDNIFDFKDPPSSSNDFLFIGNIPGRIIYAKFNIQL